MGKYAAFVCGIMLLLSSATVHAQEDDLDVPFVPTRFDIVDAMLDIANVNSGDLLYDLGCGDGRIVIRAAEKFGTRGIGIDLNPDRIDESIMNAADAGVTERVAFIEQDLFETDFSDATVITMYLLPHVNVKLRPRLFDQLRPGTRIVSHDFDMGVWKPDDSRIIYGENDNHYVYFWIIPARVEGIWKWNISIDILDMDYTLNLEQDYQNVVGTLAYGSEKTPIEHIVLEGDMITFSTSQTIDGSTYDLTYSGNVVNNAIEGSLVTKSGTKMRNCQWSAVRDPATMTPWDVDD